MILKLVAILTLLCYINTTTYIPRCLKAGFFNSPEAAASILKLPTAGVTALFPIIITEITEAPDEKSRGFGGIFYDYYNLLSIFFGSIVIKILQISFSSLSRTLDISHVREYASTKVVCLLGYYTFLFRLKPF